MTKYIVASKPEAIPAHIYPEDQIHETRTAARAEAKNLRTLSHPYKIWKVFKVVITEAK